MPDVSLTIPGDALAASLAIDAAVGLKYYPDFNAAVAAMTRGKDFFEPDPENQKIYRELYRRVYLKMYKTLLPLFAQIREITGYPE